MSTQQHHRRHHHHHHHQYQQESETENIQVKAGEDSSIRLRGYGTCRDKGGYAPDNWSEAEQTVKNNY